jgi:hypothetical protein
VTLFGEPADVGRIGCLIMIVGGTIGLRLVSPG